MINLSHDTYLWRDQVFDILNSSGLVAPDLADHIALSTSVFCERNNIQNIKSSDLTLLAARGLHAVDLVNESLVLLQKDPYHEKRSSDWVHNFNIIEKFSELFPFFSKGIIYPDKWIGLNNKKMWVLDFKQLEIKEKDFHEIMIFRSVYAILDLMIPLWNETNGMGVLGIKGLKAEVLNTLFPSDKFSHANDLLFYIQDFLQQNKLENNWKYSPDIIII